jgi:hypothetical protein
MISLYCSIIGDVSKRLREVLKPCSVVNDLLFYGEISNSLGT